MWWEGKVVAWCRRLLDCTETEDMPDQVGDSCLEVQKPRNMIVVDLHSSDRGRRQVVVGCGHMVVVVGFDREILADVVEVGVLDAGYRDCVVGRTLTDRLVRTIVDIHHHLLPRDIVHSSEQVYCRDLLVLLLHLLLGHTVLGCCSLSSILRTRSLT